jgi:hypothetical protein
MTHAGHPELLQMAILQEGQHNSGDVVFDEGIAVLAEA